MKNFFKLTTALATLMAVLAWVNTANAQLMSNDLCANALPITCGQTVTGNTYNSTIDVAPACGLNFPRFGVWYVFTGTGQSVTLSTCNTTTNYDSQIGVYSGSCGALVCVAGNDNSSTCTAGGRKSTVTFMTASGTNYYIWVTGAVSARGNFALTASCAGSVGINCATAPQISCGTPVTSTMSGSGAGWNVSACGWSTPGQEQVYRFTAPMTGVYSVQIMAGTGGYVDYFYKSASGSCDATGWTCIDDVFSPATYNISLTAGDYYFLLDGEGTSSRTHTWQISCPTAPPPPSDNDACSAATLMTCGQTLTGTTATATIDGPSTDCTGGSVAADRWYRVVGTGQSITASLCGGTSYDSKIAIYTGTCGSLSAVACNDDFCGLQSQVTWASASGVTYYIRVHGFLGATGSYSLNVSCTTLTGDTGSNSFAAANNTDPGVDMIGDFFPNPTNSLATLKVISTQDGEGFVRLFDALGRAVVERRVGLVAGSNLVELNVSALPAGTYHALVNFNGQQFQKKLVVSK